MTDYKKLYYILFAATADAIELIERGESESARRLLIQKELECEEKVIEE